MHIWGLEECFIGPTDDSTRAKGKFPLMGWSGRAPAPPAIEAGKGRQDKEHAMSQTLNAGIAVVGIDIGKNSFHIVGHDERGAIVLRQKWSRGHGEARSASTPMLLRTMRGF